MSFSLALSDESCARHDDAGFPAAVFHGDDTMNGTSDDACARRCGHRPEPRLSELERRLLHVL